MLIIHGNNLLLSRNRLLQLKEEYAKVETYQFDGKKLTIEELKQVFEAKSLFSKEKAIFIENFFCKRSLKEQKTKEIFIYLCKEKLDYPLIFWEEKEISVKSLGQITKIAKIENYKIPAPIFKFLDAFYPNNKQLLNLLKESLKNQPIELVFYLLCNRIRLLNLILTKNIDHADLKKLAPWQIGKLRRQAGFFKQNQIFLLYQKLIILDYLNKTGKLALDLKKHLDFYLLKI